MVTFSSSGLCTGDPDPAPSGSMHPFAHTSLITWQIKHKQNNNSREIKPEGNLALVNEAATNKWKHSRNIPTTARGACAIPLATAVPLGNHTAWADSPPFKKSLNISSHHCHIIKQPIAAAEQARRVMCTTCTVSFLLLTLPITLLNGSPGTIRQHSPRSEATPARACTDAG